jgi:hypothetical protein
MLDKFFILLFQKSKTILIAALIIFGGGTCFLVFKWQEPPKTFGHNILIEVFIGGLFTIVPIVFVVYVGKKFKEIEFYNRIKNLLNTIKAHRKNGDITPVATRNIVIEFSNLHGEEILEEEWLKKVIRSDWNFNNEQCGVCGLQANTTNNKCQNCKLDCFAWRE